MKEINNEQHRQSSKNEELDELNRIATNSTPQPSPDPSTSSFLLRFRRGRSTSVPAACHSDYSSPRSFDTLCETPLCKPPMITLTEHS